MTQVMNAIEFIKGLRNPKHVLFKNNFFRKHSGV